MPRDYRPTVSVQGAIGFRELRQACEISTLKEELEHLRSDAGALRRVVDETVERVRVRFAALTPDEMSDAEAMLPLLQFAVTQLIDVRDRAHAIDLGSSDVSDEDRVGAPTAIEPASEPVSTRETSGAFVSKPPAASPSPLSPEAPFVSPAPSAQRTPSALPRPTAAPPRAAPSSAAVDWLAPKPR